MRGVGVAEPDLGLCLVLAGSLSPLRQKQACDEAAAALEQRLSRRSLLTEPGPAEHLNMYHQYTHLEGVLHLSELALQYLFRQEPAFLQTQLGPAFAGRWANSHTAQLHDEQESMRSEPIVFGLALVHHRTTLLPSEMVKLERFVLQMPSVLQRYAPGVDEGARVASCCWLRGLGGILPLYWQVAHAFTFHREL